MITTTEIMALTLKPWPMPGYEAHLARQRKYNQRRKRDARIRRRDAEKAHARYLARKARGA